MNHELIEKLLESLCEIKETLRDTAEPSVIEQMNEAISQLQELKVSKESSDIVRARAWKCLGIFISSLPSIVSLIEVLTK